MNGLETKITSALTAENISSSDVAALITETEAAITAAAASAETERAKALDPTQSPDPIKAREDMQAAEFAVERLRNLHPKLKQRYAKALAAEQLAEWLPRYEAARKTRDQLAGHLSIVYPLFVESIVPLLRLIEDSDREIWKVNHDAPRDAGKYLYGVEHEARGSGFNPLVKNLRLPAWEPKAMPVWPPHRIIDPAVFAPPPSDPRLYTSRWSEVYEERAARARAEEERKQAEAETKFLAAHPGTDWQARWEREAKAHAARARP